MGSIQNPPLRYASFYGLGELQTFLRGDLVTRQPGDPAIRRVPSNPNLGRRAIHLKDGHMLTQGFLAEEALVALRNGT